MARVIVIGAGMGGLAAALFCARRGHEVIVLERDGGVPSAESPADNDFLSWERPGVPHARQGHAFLALSTRVLREEAPDVIDALAARGADVVPVEGIPGEANVLSRRLVYEAVLRRAVQHESGVEVRAAAVRHLLASQGAGPVPVVHGVELSTGEQVGGDLVVDATGRRSAVAGWLAELNVSLPAESAQPCGFFYLTRHYRLHTGQIFPAVEVPVVAELDYATVIAFPGDNGRYQLSATVAVQDPARHRLREAETFQRLLASVPLTEPWTKVGTPTDEPRAMARIENRWRTLMSDGRPVAGGLVLLADAAMQLNPTFGRGVSLAFAHAQRLAQIAERFPADAVGAVAEFEQWTKERLGVWYDAQVATDATRIRQLAAGLDGTRIAPPSDLASKFAAAMTVMRDTDEDVRAASIRLYNLLITPAELMADRAVARRILAFVRAHPDLDHPVTGLSRPEFERLVL